MSNEFTSQTPLSFGSDIGGNTDNYYDTLKFHSSGLSLSFGQDFSSNQSNGFSTVDKRFTFSSDLVGGATNHVSPLVFDLDGDGIELTHAYDQSVFFDIDNDAYAERVGWVAPDDGLLAMDHNGNGNIDDITELYGDDIMPAFDKLALHDSNDDGVIDANDVDFDKFLIWRDLNQNGLTEDGELQSLTEADIVSISLDEQPDSRWIEENYISSNSTFTWAGGQTGELVDAHFLNDNADSWYKGAEGEVFGSEIEIDFDALILPQSRGYGELAAFHIAMSKDATLKEMMQDLTRLGPWGYGGGTGNDRGLPFAMGWRRGQQPRCPGDGRWLEHRCTARRTFWKRSPASPGCSAA